MALSRTDLMTNNYNCLSLYSNYPNYYYRCSGCDTNLTSNTPANQYQRQKIIQNTVRVPSSLYTMNLGSLSAYQKPENALYKVNWNQMSDRALPSVQKSNATGATYHSSSTKSTITRLQPGAMSPGGVGCDIKHNSYERYLNRLKGKSFLRRGTIPYDFGFGLKNYKFNRAFPIYGGKTTKLNIINGCNCPLTPSNDNNEIQKSVYLDSNVLLVNPYKNSIYKHVYNLYDTVYFTYDNSLINGTIIENINNSNTEYLVEFDHNNKTEVLTLNYYDIYSDNELKTYTGTGTGVGDNCNCVESCGTDNNLSIKYYNEDGVLQECSLNYDNVTGISSS
jgi:hypothetical protein